MLLCKPQDPKVNLGFELKVSPEPTNRKRRGAPFERHFKLLCMAFSKGQQKVIISQKGLLGELDYFLFECLRPQQQGTSSFGSVLHFNRIHCDCSLDMEVVQSFSEGKSQV